MSHVLSVVVIASICEEEEDHPGGGMYLPSPFAHLNCALRNEHGGPGWRLESVCKAAGGSKALQFHLWAGGLNHCQPETFKAMVRAAPWREPESVVVIYEDEHDESPTVWKLA